jgi:hypothetical protein
MVARHEMPECPEALQFGHFREGVSGKGRSALTATIGSYFRLVSTLDLAPL